MLANQTNPAIRDLIGWAGITILSLAAVLAGCGGGQDPWDEFLPRAAQAEDIANQAFVFRDFSHGAVFDATLASTTTTLAFLGATPTGPAARLPFSVGARSATSSGTATLEGSTLQLQFEQVDASLPFTKGRDLAFEITADVDDGRIRLRNLETGVEQASAPR